MLGRDPLILNFEGTPYVRKDVDPTTGDNLYGVPTIWINETDNTFFILVDVTAGAATWTKMPDALLDHSRSHSITSTSDHTSTATEGKVLKADANGLPVDSSNTAEELAVAVSNTHIEATAGDGVSVVGQVVTNTDRGSTAVSTHEGSYTHSDIALNTASRHDAVTMTDTELLSLTGQAISLKTKTANTVLAGPTTGDAATPTFRSLVAGDIPSLSYDPAGTGHTEASSHVSTHESTYTHTDIASNTSARHTQGTDTTLGSMSEDIDMNTHQVTGLSAPDAPGEAIRQTATITEAALENAINLARESYSQFPAGEALAAGNFVNLYSDSGTIKARKATCDDYTKPADGYVRSNYDAAATANVYRPGTANDVLSGLTPGANYWLSTAGGVTDAATVSSGYIVQLLGIATSATSLDFVRHEDVRLT